MWQTPKDSAGGNVSRGNDRKAEPLLAGQAEQHSLSFPPAPTTSTLGDKSSKSTRRLNPRFVEWLMGWPLGWTDFEPVETASYLCRQRMHLWSLLDGRG